LILCWVSNCTSLQVFSLVDLFFFFLKKTKKNFDLSMEASWYHPRRRLSDYPNLSIVSFFAWVLLHIFIFLFVCHSLYIILIMSSKCIFNGNYCFNSQESVRIHLNYFIVAFEAGFHTELKAFFFSSSRYFIEHSVPVLLRTYFPKLR
jgi:hypothetical protein